MIPDGVSRVLRTGLGALALGAAALLPAVGCGRKAPPFLTASVPAREMKITGLLVREGEVRVEFRIPRETISLHKPEEPWVQARLLRRPVDAPGAEYELRTAQREEGGYAFGERRTLVDRGGMKEGTAFFYVAELRKEKSKEWASSEPVAVRLPFLPATTGEVTVEGREGAISLAWQGLRKEGSGFEVWRRAEAGEPSLPVTPDPLQRSSFIDTGVKREVRYCYKVRSVLREGPVTVEGPFSPEVCAASADLTPPPAPRNVLLHLAGGGLKVTWQPSEATDLEGYFIYRSRGGGPFERLNDSPVKGTSYLDAEVEGGVLHRYRVTAVDDSAGGNESPFSETVSMEAPGDR